MFWADGFWAAGFWADDFWVGFGGGEPAVVVVRFVRTTRRTRSF